MAIPSVNCEVQVFDTYEERQQRFAHETGIVCPSTTSGFSTSLHQISDWLFSSSKSKGFSAIIPGDPSLALVFPTVKDELLAAASRRGSTHTMDACDDIIRAFEFSPDLKDQAVRTLSGGERCQVALMKCALLADGNRRLVMCNPEAWLSESNAKLVFRTLDKYKRSASSSIFLGLRGDNLLAKLENQQTEKQYVPCREDAFRGPAIHLVFNSATVLLADAAGLSRNLPLRISYAGEVRGSSPLLLMGPNGLGKSALALALSGGLKLESGDFSVQVGNFISTARVLMQRCSDQLFGLRPLDYLAWVFREAHDKEQEAKELYRAIEGQVNARLTAQEESILIGPLDSPNTLLQARIALVSSRLIQHHRGLLVLDEPGFGLSRSAGMAFLEAIAVTASRRETAIVVISHKPDWYEHIVETTVACEFEELHSLSFRERAVTFKVVVR
jgi:energy-coupling factor transporter ATP-binding protein EcfA2